MNRTEQVAAVWLQDHGYSNVVFQGKKTPDFYTDKGLFEVKRAYETTLVFYPHQIEAIVKTDAKVLVFKDKRDPVAILDSKDVAQPFAKGFRITVVNPTGTVVQLKQSTYNDLSEIRRRFESEEKGRFSMDDIVALALETVRDDNRLMVELYKKGFLKRR